LEILKPTPAQLQHGLELHAQSLVFDSYGFAPRAAVDGQAIAAAIEEGALAAEVEDLREEMS
jgi:membrane dipeptidase